MKYKTLIILVVSLSLIACASSQKRLEKKKEEDPPISTIQSQVPSIAFVWGHHSRPSLELHNTR